MKRKVNNVKTFAQKKAKSGKEKLSLTNDKTSAIGNSHSEKLKAERKVN